MNKNKKKFFISLIFLFLLILIVFLISKINFGYIGFVPTGNVDIFNIECNKKDDVCDCTGNNQENNLKNDNEKEETKTVFNEDTGELNVYDNEKTWDANTKLRIFSNPAYEFKNIVSPGSNNVYQFVINNNNNFSIIYKIKLIETNPYKINMRYKIKRNGEFIYGNDSKWVSAEEIEKEGLDLLKKSHDTYTLIWKWIDNDPIDTIAGFDLADYNLSININASSI